MKKLGWMLAVLACVALAGSAFAADKLTSIEQLATEKISAQRGTTGQMIAEELLGDNVKGNLVTYEKYVDAIATLRQGKVRAVIMDENPAKKFVASAGDIVIMNEPLSVEAYAIGFKKGNTELVEAVNKALAELKADGTIAAIIDKYQSDDVNVTPEDIDLNKGAGKKLVVGTEAGFAPYELKVADGFIGIDIEMCAAIAKKLGYELEIQNMNFDALPMAVAAGKVDMICAGMTVTEDRKKNMDFSDNYVEDARQVAVVRADDYAPEAK